MDFQPRPRRNTNIDGFIRPPKKQTHAFYSGRTPDGSLPTAPALTPQPYRAPVTLAPVAVAPTSAPFSEPIEELATDVIEPTAVSYDNNGETSDLNPYADKSRRPVQLAKKRWKKRVFRSALGALVLLLIVGGWLGFQLMHNVNKVFHGNIISDVKALSSQAVLNGEQNGRVNILLAGDSADDPDHQGAQLTDSILILSVDTKNHTAFLLSIPRDLWVSIPGSTWPGGTYQKINAANEVTNFSEPGYPSNGMGALSYIVQNDLGIPIDYYGLMDYGAFKDAVDAVGGVTIDVQSSDPRGLYDPNTNLNLPNGEVTLTGQQALNLARARGDGYGSYGFPNSDFDRTQHQRQLFVAVAEKAKSVGVLSNPLKVNDLFGAFGNNFQTNLNLNDVLSLIQLTKSIDPTTIQSYAYSSTLSGGSTTGKPLIESYTDPATGEDALIPSAGLGNYGQMENYYKQLTSSNPIVKEDPTVEILNGSQIDGLAAKESAKLTADGYDVVGVTDAINEYPDSMIINQSGGQMPASLALLQKTFSSDTTTATLPSSLPEAAEAKGYTASFVVVLGENWDATSGSATTTSSGSSTN
jgi:LCP family protein required for cell wall assembly